MSLNAVAHLNFHGLGVLVWSPLAMGLLAGRLRRGGAETVSAGRLHRPSGSPWSRRTSGGGDHW